MTVAAPRSTRIADRRGRAAALRPVAGARRRFLNHAGCLMAGS